MDPIPTPAPNPAPPPSGTATGLADRLDMARIRAEFPALTGGAVYLDNAGGSLVLRRVAERIADYLMHHSVQLGASYAASMAAAAKVQAARAAVAELVHAPADDEVVIGGSTTGLMFQFTSALRGLIRPGDEIIVTESDHEANIGAWMRLREAGAVVTVWPLDRDTLCLEPATLQTLLGPRTAWVAMTWASNILGTVNPVAEVARMVHAAGARLCVDAVAYAPHRLIDVQTSGADVVVFSFYKVFGPHLAVLWARRELLQALPGINHYFIGADELAYKLQPGNLNYELSYGCIGITDYLVDVGTAEGATGSRRQRMQAAFDAFERQEDLLAERLLAFLRQRAGVRIIGLPGLAHGRRLPTISFVVDGLASPEIVRAIDPHGIGIRHGDFYARRLIEGLGLQAAGGVVRVSIAHYNTLAEIDRLIGHLGEVLDRAGQLPAPGG